MPTYYSPPLEDIRFSLEAFGYNEVIQGMERFEDFDLDTSMSLLEEYAKFCVDVLMPLNQTGDKVGVAFDPDTYAVTMPPGFKEAFAGFSENGYGSVPFNPEYGGMGAPFSVATLAGEVLIATNKSFSMCSGLTSGLIDALEAHGTEEQKATYLPKFISGEWTGTMCLTEPQCGTDLGLMTTKAERQSDDSYLITGTKIWITFGDHDMAENIVHFVLARTTDAPPGIKGVSVFLVPKFLDDGTRNPVYVTGTDHKMGIHASPTCVVNLENAKGWLVGDENKGMRSMFTMMNAARLNVGIEGVALAEAAYQAALAFAKDRRQSRSLSPKKQDREHDADNILVHPDVRRMLLNIKSTVEPLRGLVAWISMMYDVWHHSTDEKAAERAGDLVALLTPIIKSYGSERGFQNISDAMQVCGGAGFTQDWPIEQYLRDERIAMIYEGTNHIQALDLVGRKLALNGGRAMRIFAEEVTNLIRSSSDIPEMQPFLAALKVESKRLNATTMEMGAKAAADHELIGAVSSAYLNQFAMVTLAYVWGVQIKAVLALPEDNPMRRSKLQTAKFFYEQVLPEAELYARRVAAGKESMTEIDVDLL